tara:strand:+ start:389 stop:514 length:126 start_codon:yes stop_codon:yes gene_type:complete
MIKRGSMPPFFISRNMKSLRERKKERKKRRKKWYKEEERYL